MNYKITWMILPSLLLVTSNLASGYYDEEPACKDVTLGDCTINPDFIIQEVSGIPLKACQEACEIYANCEIFRFEGTNCMLLSYDYRQECRNSAAPVGHYVEDCLASYDVSCDRIIGEACDYLGKLVFEAPPGAIVDPTHCEQLCTANDFLGCVYYYYEQGGRKCYLYDSDERTCHAVGGPQNPLINECRGTTNIPISTESTTDNPAPTTTSNEKCPYTVFKGTSENLVPLGPYDVCCDTLTCINDNNYCNIWTFDHDGKEISQTKNNEPATILLDDEPVQGVDFNGTMKVDENFDDDWIGFAFGFEDTSHFFVVLSPSSRNPKYKDHWRVTKVESVTGDSSKEMADAITYFEEGINGQTEVLWRDTVENNGWTHETNYLWKLQYRPIQGKLKVQIFAESNLIIDTNVVTFTETKKYEQFGVFVRSQPSVNWFDMSYECNDDDIL